MSNTTKSALFWSIVMFCVCVGLLMGLSGSPITGVAAMSVAIWAVVMWGLEHNWAERLWIIKSEWKLLLLEAETRDVATDLLSAVVADPHSDASLMLDARLQELRVYRVTLARKVHDVRYDLGIETYRSTN